MYSLFLALMLAFPMGESGEVFLEVDRNMTEVVAEFPAQVQKTLVSCSACEKNTDEVGFYLQRFGIVWCYDCTREAFTMLNEMVRERRGMRRLETLEEHEARRPKLEVSQETPCGIACPECGAELYQNLTYVLTSNPPQYPVSCKKCNWRGTIH